ncbi:aminopeptidase N [Microbacterium sediminis]|uniref:Aminopeptidase N n=1 Tax=Microbacterium sediminis TaxID=904291 RepID=A0A1B9NIX4_9MICO|nr:aminopeptidase N [Microbacterium sediminis]OCG76541.1 aminopeptidase N [Microbacterium sediminis]QBR73854.1 aminopeptidase N [Microbacterium sediminis]
MTDPNASANLTREETAARAASITLHEVHVSLDLTEAKDPERSGFPTASTFFLEAATPETWVDFLGEDVVAVTVNGADIPVDWDGARVRITGLEPGRRNVVQVRAVGAYSRSGEGLHRFVDPADGETYLYTQFEPADSRRLMPVFEQPDMKARWQFSVAAPREWIVLSNQSIAHHTSDDAQYPLFHETLPISSYITAIAAGPYHRAEGEWTRGDQTVPLGVLCRASLAEHLDADEILEITRQGLDFFTDAFGYPYPWGKYDQIFVPEYNLGAMENPGLVTFTEAYVFRGAATDAQREARANTILHEMAHMWFGDLVTMRWWDDLWLKESFADYMGSHASVAATRFADAWASFANRRKAWAYQQDQLPTTHPIVADIPDLEAAKLNFDGITYAKGASVLKQLVAFVGEEAFFAGARAYFRAHAFGNTTLDDLLAALGEASGRDVRAWSRAWLETTGMSTLSLEDGALVQTDPRPHRLRVGLFDLTEGRLERRESVELDIAAARTPVDLRGADLTLINDGDLTYAKARLDARSLATVEEALSGLGDTLARGLVWSQLWNATRDAELSPQRYLAIVARHAPRETNAALLAGAIANAAYTVNHYLPEHELAGARAAWLETAWRAMIDATPGSDAQLAWARAVGHAAAYADGRAAELRAILGGDAPAPEGLRLDPDLRWAWMQGLAASGAVDADAIEAERRRDDTMSGRTAAIEALAARPDADVRAAAWRAAWDDATLSNDHLGATIAGFRAGGRRDLIAGFDAEYFERILPTWRTRSIEIARRLVAGMFPASDSTDAADAWLEAHAHAPASLRRIVIEQRDHLARDLRVRAAASRP